MTKYQLRAPEPYDLAAAPWKLQPRGPNGRWIDTPGGALIHAAKGLSDLDSPGDSPKTPSPTAIRAGWKHKKGEWGFDNPATHRHVGRLSRDERKQLYKDNGIEMQFPGLSDEDLLDKFTEASSTKEQQAYTDEVQRRLRGLQLTQGAINRHFADAKRGDKVNYFKRLDAQLGKSKAGRSLIKLRDAILTDERMDFLGKAGEGVRDQGKKYGFALAASGAAAALLGPLGLFIAPVAKEVGIPVVTTMLNTALNYSGAQSIQRAHDTFKRRKQEAEDVLGRARREAAKTAKTAKKVTRLKPRHRRTVGEGVT
ncbi:MAG: hypothetical protein ACRDQA_22860 [Nocardioidaceae bacterium]